MIQQGIGPSSIVATVIATIVMMLIIYNQGHVALSDNPNRNLFHCCHLLSSTLVWILFGISIIVIVIDNIGVISSQPLTQTLV